MELVATYVFELEHQYGRYHLYHQSRVVMKNTSCWSVVVRSSVPDGVTFTYPQHLVPDEGDIDIPSNSTDVELPIFVLHDDRRCYAYQLLPK